MSFTTVYSPSNKDTDPSLSFLHLYTSLNDSFYNHTLKYSFILSSKLLKNTVEDMLIEILTKYGLSRQWTSVIRGLDSTNYETEDDEAFEDVVSTSNYFDYLYCFNLAANLGVSISYSNDGSHFFEIIVVYKNIEHREVAEKLFETLCDTFTPLKKLPSAKNYVNFICQSQHGLYLHELKIKSVAELDLKNNYNDDFEPISDHIIASLSKNAGKGIYLLHGLHGTGKTSYLRYLIHVLKRNIIYVSPDMSSRISDPSFLTFLLNHKNSILMIEDAENILKTRESGENQAVSNLLNITDGILGDGLNFQVICTFNTGFSDIDPALKRKGRMIAQYEFKRLVPEKTEKLVKSIYGDSAIPTADEMSLAEIYNMEDDNFEIVKPEGKFGFI
jgi:hypothetical protein